jgi:hypothetical protein
MVYPCSISSASGSIVKHRIQGFVHSEYFLEILPGEFAISQDLSKESAPNRLAAVYRYDCAPAIWMAQEMVTALHTDHFKTNFPKGFDKLGTSDCRKSVHEETATR